MEMDCVSSLLGMTLEIVFDILILSHRLLSLRPHNCLARGIMMIYIHLNRHLPSVNLADLTDAID